jgi:hypothetical protein
MKLIRCTIRFLWKVKPAMITGGHQVVKKCNVTVFMNIIARFGKNGKGILSQGKGVG